MAGGIARREIFVPELCRDVRDQKEAWLDVWIYGIPEIPDALVDVTVRHPRAERYRPAAEAQPGAAAARADPYARRCHCCRAGYTLPWSEPLLLLRRCVVTPDSGPLNNKNKKTSSHMRLYA